jgi:predicted branched-subunit amino acid permease
MHNKLQQFIRGAKLMLPLAVPTAIIAVLYGALAKSIG